MNLNEQLKKFFKDNEWNINKLKGSDVYYYIEENFKLDVDGETEYLHKLGFQCGFGAGAESRQQEIEKLQSKIEELKVWCISGVTSDMLSVEYNRALLDVLEVLKGDL